MDEEIPCLYETKTVYPTLINSWQKIVQKLIELTPEMEVDETTLSFLAKPKRRRKQIIHRISENISEFLDENTFNSLYCNVYLSLNRNFLLNSRESARKQLWQLANVPEPRIPPYNYNQTEINARMAILLKQIDYFGLLSTDQINELLEGKVLDYLSYQNHSHKYKTYDELKDLTNKFIKKTRKGVVGIVQGAFDPPHVFHAKTIADIWPYCDMVLVGFDKNSLLKYRKGDDRPRFPQLSWRMSEIASLPTVDYVFTLPVDPPPTEEKFRQIYRDLNIGIIGADDENPFLSSYEKHMVEIGGNVISSENLFSSTELMRLVEKRRGGYMSKRVMDEWADGRKEEMQYWQELSPLESNPGYLHDYPDGT